MTSAAFKRTLAIGLLLGIVFVAVSPALTHAAFNPNAAEGCGLLDIFCNIRDALNWFMKWVMALILSLTGLLIAFMSTLIELMITVSRDLIGGNPLIQNGFRITLGIANLGFVLAIIVIAFGTILRIEKYEMKKTLERLIIAAIMVNFSLTIAGLIFDFTNVLSYFFIDKVTAGTTAAGGAPGTSQFGEEMAASLNIQDSINIRKATDRLGGGGAIGGTANIADLLVDFFAGFASLFLAVAFSILVLIIFSAIAFMLVVRYIYLTILIILMPLAWLFWTIPDLQSYWSKWWSKFFQWTFFLPAVTFFLYLAMLSSRGVDAIIATNVKDQMANPFGSAMALDTSVLQSGGATGFLQIFVKIGLFVAALMVGQSLGITGSKAAMGLATSMGKKFVGSEKGWLNKQGGKVVGATVKGIAKVPVLKTVMGGARVPFTEKRIPGISKPVGDQVVIQKGEKAEKLQKKANAVSLETEADLHDTRGIAGQSLRTTINPAQREKIMVARLALAKNEESGKGSYVVQERNRHTGEIEERRIAVPPSESKKNNRMATITTAHVTRKNKVETDQKTKKEKDENDEKLEELFHKYSKKTEGTAEEKPVAATH